MERHFLGQLLLVGVPGPELDSATAERFREIQPGGFILFGRNIQKADQLRKLIDDLRDLSRFEPIITIDQEGGRVSRLRLIGEEPPNAEALRKKGDLKLIRQHGKLTGQLLRLFGFNLDLCPVLDISQDGDLENSLFGRCYGETPNEVIEKAGEFNRALRKEGILSCGKHFPGYAMAKVDPHHALSVIDRTEAEMEAHELLPYRTLLPELDSVMVAHAHYPWLEPEKERWPASLSESCIQQFLRNQLGFDGLVMTDDLDMGAILHEVTFEDTIRHAITAGNDLAMICHRIELIEEAHRVLETLPHPVLDDALRRVETFKKKMAPPTSWSMDRFTKFNEQVWDLRVEVLGEEAAHIRSTEDGARSPVELY
ncbi:MAG: glycoside hydrolase family 3 N-terminal domain-containing protein [Verrucomicrobiota bacterium]